MELLIEPLECALQLLRDEIVLLVRFANRQRFADAQHHLQPAPHDGLQRREDDLVGHVVHGTPFRVTDEDPLDVETLQHCRADLAGVSAVVVGTHVLGPDVHGNALGFDD